MRIGVVGLGCGVLATYGRKADEFDLIEINPAVVRIANEHFTFLADSDATLHTHLGDGRLVLERLQGSRFDLLVLDAFSSDAIPAHLLTREAIQLYQDRLADDGVLAIHVSNNHLDLVPLTHRLGQDAGLETGMIHSQGDQTDCTRQAMWVILADPQHTIWTSPALKAAQFASKEELADAPLWTDQRHNLVSVLRFWSTP